MKTVDEIDREIKRLEGESEIRKRKISIAEERISDLESELEDMQSSLRITNKSIAKLELEYEKAMRNESEPDEILDALIYLGMPR